MGYYDEGVPELLLLHGLAVRPVGPLVLADESKSIPNRIATFTGGTTQGLTQDPGGTISSMSSIATHLSRAR